MVEENYSFGHIKQNQATLHTNQEKIGDKTKKTFGREAWLGQPASDVYAGDCMKRLFL